MYLTGTLYKDMTFAKAFSLAEFPIIYTLSTSSLSLKRIIILGSLLRTETELMSL